MRENTARGVDPHDPGVARVPPITRRDQLAQADQPHFDAIVAPRGGQVTAPFRVLLHVPELAARYAHLTAYSRFEARASVPEDVKELAICAAARELDCAYEWGDHEPRALHAGVTPDTIETLRERGALDRLPRPDAQVVRWVQSLLRPPHRIDDELFHSMRERLGVRGIVELTGVLGAYVALACTFNAFEIAPEPGKPVLPT